jgi:hypothetical protein
MSFFNDQFYDPVYLIIKCEKIYNVVLFIQEAIFIDTDGLSMRNIHNLFMFLKKEKEPNDDVIKWINNNIEEISKVRPFYLEYLRNNKLNKIFNK